MHPTTASAPTPGPNACLVIGSRAGSRFELTPPGPYVLGRGPQADLVLKEAHGLSRAALITVSRRHAVLKWEEGHWILRDLDSANGVWIFGMRSGLNCLRSGCRINLGRVPLWFHYYSAYPPGARHV